MKTIKRVGVFCGSSPGAEPEYLDAAGGLAQALVSRRIGLVYGGAGERSLMVERVGGAG